MPNKYDPKKVLYEGDNPKLVNGRYYLVKEIAELVGITAGVVHYRLKGSLICTDDELVTCHAGRTVREHKVKVLLTTSQKWLTRKLV